MPGHAVQLARVPNADGQLRSGPKLTSLRQSRLCLKSCDLSNKQCHFIRIWYLEGASIANPYCVMRFSGAYLATLFSLIDCLSARDFIPPTKFGLKFREFLHPSLLTTTLSPAFQIPIRHEHFAHNSTLNFVQNNGISFDCVDTFRSVPLLPQQR